MKQKFQDTFLIGHARRMRKLRQRQREADLEAYKMKVNNQRREHRLRSRFYVLSESQTIEKLDSLIKSRQTTKERLRRYRLNESIEKKALRLKADRKYQSLKYEKIRNNKSDVENSDHMNELSYIFNEIPKYETINNTRYIFDNCCS
ncbi:unnamed protein product [Rotaria magnacalcarata]|uniref:Uncharacterized protein n=1 Tax=Rotaria magnacalcarata TaxID=392030 RepID=A0A820KMX1_9BILA|nr:unnamed protein product [Rotaria magnacalcarata]CAF4339727.1 unnamed protein product [Rotaria magnacalcarata]